MPTSPITIARATSRSNASIPPSPCRSRLVCAVRSHREAFPSHVACSSLHALRFADANAGTIQRTRRIGGNDDPSSMNGTRAMRHLIACAVVAGALMALSTPAIAITGGHRGHEEPVLQRRDGRLLPARRALPLHGHADRAEGACSRPPTARSRTSGRSSSPSIPLISRTEAEAERDIPRAADDSGPDDAISDVGFTHGDVTAPAYDGEQTWFLGTARTHPDYSDFTDIRNWNDTGVIILDRRPGSPRRPSPRRTTSTSSVSRG